MDYDFDSRILYNSDSVTEFRKRETFWKRSAASIDILGRFQNNGSEWNHQMGL